MRPTPNRSRLPSRPLRGGEIATLGCGILLLLPGGCFLFYNPVFGATRVGIVIILIAVCLFFGVFIFHRRHRPGEPPA
jgi:hypothetical protein